MKKLLIGAGLVAIFALMPSSQIYSQDASVRIVSIEKLTNHVIKSKVLLGEDSLVL